MNSKIKDNDPEYKRCCDSGLEHLTYEDAKNILDTFDEDLRNQAEYDYSQLSEDLAQDNEAVTAIQSRRKSILTNSII